MQNPSVHVKKLHLMLTILGYENQVWCIRHIAYVEVQCTRPQNNNDLLIWLQNAPFSLEVGHYCGKKKV